jgi:hypothetical protein
MKRKTFKILFFLKKSKLLKNGEAPICMRITRDVFIFCCYTGLAFSYVQQLSESHLIKGQNGEMWIRKARQKTKNMCNIPLLPIPVEMFEKYRNHPDCIKTGKLFPVPSNQR